MSAWQGHVLELIAGGEMRFYSGAEIERTMKVKEVILRAMVKRITWWQAAEILGISARQMKRWKRRYEEYGYDGLYDRRRQRPSRGNMSGPVLGSSKSPSLARVK
jgi:hypothetical protein